MEPQFSFVIPVYNRPAEIKELLESLSAMESDIPFEVVIVEDGSSDRCEQAVADHRDRLSISYYYKANSGPGDSRNYGMSRAAANYFIILDSDCLVPRHYLQTVATSLAASYVDCYGGPDTAHGSFTPVQKAINYAMTAVLTTGGIRGRRKQAGGFQPRSFNMGLSRAAFEATQGFGNIHPGEDPDLSLRLKKLGFETRLIPEAYVYHKRRIDFSSFLKQVKKFGMARPILNRWHPGSGRLSYWFPTAFLTGFLLMALLLLLGIKPYGWLLAAGYGLYGMLIFADALLKNGSLPVAILALWAVLIQFAGYGYGFLKSIILVNFSNREPRELFPELFF